MSTPPPPSPTPTPLPSSPSSSNPQRDYRKGNWTLSETNALIDAKRIDDEWRIHLKSQPHSSIRSAEHRWKSVEDYCYSNGCRRSQNQCNDKWDNLFRDYKKVRDYESRQGQLNGPSYWTMERDERKERNLPISVTPEIYHEMAEAVRRKNEIKSMRLARRGPLPQPGPVLALAPAPQPAVVTPALQGLPARPSGPSDMSESSDTEDDPIEPEPQRQTAPRAGPGVVEGASVLARTLIECEEKRDKRHRDLMKLKQKRIRIETDRTEMYREGMTGLVSAVNSLAGAIGALAASNGSGSGSGNGNGDGSDHCL